MQHLGQQDPAALERWRALRASGDVQMAPPAPWHRAPPSPWLEGLFRWLGDRFLPAARLFGTAWPWVERALIAAAVLGLLWLGWVWLSPWLRRRRPVMAELAEGPPDEAVLALLEEADDLAARGDYAGATHLLLKRSVAALAAARPGLVHPASTAREIAHMGALSTPAREAFATMAVRVEASRYALRALAREDWLAARAAYAAFARVSAMPA